MLSPLRCSDSDNTQKPHVLKTRTTESEGWHIKLFPECGWYKTTVKVADGIDIESLIDFVDYKYTYEQYEDEDIATIIKIEAV